MPLPGFIAERDFTTGENDALASYTPSPTSTVRQTLLSGGTVGQLTPMLGRSVQRAVEVADELAGGGAPRLSAEEATKRFGIPGELGFSAPVTESEAAYKNRNKRDELFRRDILARNETVGPLSSFGLSVAGSLIDPASLALNAVPVVGEGRVLAALGVAGKAAANSRRAAALAGSARGAYQGAYGGLLGEGLTLGGAALEGREYSPEEALVGVTAGALFGAPLGGGLEGATWRSPAQAARGRSAQTIREAAKAAGEDGDLAVRIAQLESGLDPTAKNPKSTAGGLFQFVDGTWDEMGGGDRLDPVLSSERGVELIRRNKASLRKALGREPQGWEVYLAHQQGAGGASALLRDPNALAVDALASLKGVSRKAAEQRIILNGGRADMTAGEFAGLWATKFNGSPAFTPQPGAPAPVVDRLPRAVAMLDEVAREGALARAIEDLSEGRPVAVGELLEIEAGRGGIERPELDEAPGGFGLSIPGRMAEFTKAIPTARGREILVRHALVELDDLTAPVDRAGVRNVDFPEGLRAEGVERSEYPSGVDWLMAQPPLIARDGVVEAGSGALRVLDGADVVDQAAYVRGLKAAGYDVEGMRRPVLVQVREEAMTGAQRVALSRELAADDGLPVAPARPPEQLAAAEGADAPRIYEAAARRATEASPVDEAPAAPKTPEEEVAALQAEIADLEASLPEADRKALADDGPAEKDINDAVAAAALCMSNGVA